MSQSHKLGFVALVLRMKHKEVRALSVSVVVSSAAECTPSGVLCIGTANVSVHARHGWLLLEKRYRMSSHIPVGDFSTCCFRQRNTIGSYSSIVPSGCWLTHISRARNHPMLKVDSRFINIPLGGYRVTRLGPRKKCYRNVFVF